MWSNDVETKDKFQSLRAALPRWTGACRWCNFEKKRLTVPEMRTEKRADRKQGKITPNDSLRVIYGGGWGEVKPLEKWGNSNICSRRGGSEIPSLLHSFPTYSY